MTGFLQQTSLSVGNRAPVTALSLPLVPETDSALWEGREEVGEGRHPLLSRASLAAERWPRGRPSSHAASDGNAGFQQICPLGFHIM